MDKSIPCKRLVGIDCNHIEVDEGLMLEVNGVNTAGLILQG